MIDIVPGVRYWPNCLDPNAQRELLQAVQEVIAAAPLFTPCMPRSGKPLSVRMTSCGALGWVTDAGGLSVPGLPPGDAIGMASDSGAGP